MAKARASGGLSAAALADRAEVVELRERVAQLQADRDYLNSQIRSLQRQIDMQLVKLGDLPKDYTRWESR